MTDLEPTNHSLQFLRLAWKQCLVGATRYLLHHPLAGPKVLLSRLHLPMKKTPLGRTIKTPEGFTLRTNQEVFLYCDMFVERALYHPELDRSLRRQVNPFILDVGACLGMAAQWFASINSTSRIHAFEPDEMIERASEINQERIGVPVHIKFNRCWVADQDAPPERITLDHYMEGKIASEVFLLKLDTDGNNAAILKGAANTLRKTRWVLVEKEPGLEEGIPGFTRISESVEDMLFLRDGIRNDGPDAYLWNR